MMEINPNITPEGISLDEIREIVERGLDQVRFFKMESMGHIISLVALRGIYLAEDFGDTHYFIEKIPELVRGRFLEIGSGTGIVTIAVALENSTYFSRSSEKYVAIDINPDAVKNTRINIMINGVEDSIEVRQGDVFEPLEEGERFDNIFWAHPFHKGSGKKDENIICFDLFFQGLEKYVQDGHRFLNKGGRQ